MIIAVFFTLQIIQQIALVLVTLGRFLFSSFQVLSSALPEKQIRDTQDSYGFHLITLDRLHQALFPRFYYASAQEHQHDYSTEVCFHVMRPGA